MAPETPENPAISLTVALEAFSLMPANPEFRHRHAMHARIVEAIDGNLPEELPTGTLVRIRLSPDENVDHPLLDLVNAWRPGGVESGTHITLRGCVLTDRGSWDLPLLYAESYDPSILPGHEAPKP